MTSIVAIAASLAFAPMAALAAPPLRAVAPSASAGAASKRCGVASDEAIFEAPGVQVYLKRLGVHKRGGVRQQSLIACVLPAHTSRVIDTIAEHAGASFAVNALIGGRYLLTTLSGGGVVGVSVEERFLDLQSGRHISEYPGGVGVARDGTLAPEATVVAPGEFVFFKAPGQEEENTLIARFTANKGHTRLDTGEKIQALAASEHVIYWINGSTVKSAAVPAASPAATGAALRPGARGDDATAVGEGVIATAHKAKPNPAKRRCEASGTKTLYRSQSRLRVLQQPDGRIFGCSDTIGKLFALNTALPGVTPTGPPTKIELLNAGSILQGVTLTYQFPAESAGGAVTALIAADPSTGAILRSALAPTSVTDWTYGPQGMNSGTIAYTEGGTLTAVDAPGSQQIDAGAISDLAVTPPTPEERGPFELYWTNSGTPKSYSIKVKAG